MTTFNLPDLGEGLPEAEIVSWHVKEGDRVQVDQPMVSVETAKAVVEVPSPYTGTIKVLHAKAGDVVGTGQPLVDFEVEGNGANVAAKAPAPPPKVNPKKADDSGTVVGSMPTSDEELIESAVAGGTRGARVERVRAAPAVRALAKKLGVTLETVRPTGRGGLITVDDVMSAQKSPDAYSPTRPSPQTARAPASRPTPVAPVTPATGEADRLRGLRRGMAHTMALSRDAVASCTLFDDADLHAWVRKSDYTVRMLRALAAAARAEPALNAHFDGESATRKVFDRVDVAIAIDTPEGLIVPVLRNVGGKSADDLRAELKTLKEASAARTVAPEDLRDFTIMLSNFGTIAGRYATPLVVPPAVAILGSGVLRHDVVAVMGGIEAHLRMPLSLTFDHRCVTGGEAARFLAAVIKDLEMAH
ncbi:MAG TPA: dihydrolipoamide acetyltransferase family protein [Steroidobacteraceae bacterium]|nr:dihydrolipoamide acetyltransferase family protein [Steroidobacteraceae bacterium]